MLKDKKFFFEGQHHEEIVRILSKKVKTIKDLSELNAKFENINFFKSFKGKIDDESFSKLLKNLTYEKLRPNQLLFRAGDYADKYFTKMQKKYLVHQTSFKTFVNVFIYD